MRRIAEAYCETRTGLGFGPGLGPVQNSDSRKTQTPHSDLPSKKVGLDLSPQNPASINKKTEFKTGLIKILHPFSKLRNRKKISCKCQFYETNCYK